ncbi:DoxX family protein [Pseudomonas sp. TE3610]
MTPHRHHPADLALLWLRVCAAVFLLTVHGLPKLLNFQAQLQLIEDPFHLGAVPTLCLAIFAEVLCPLLIIAGVFTRLACLPVLAVLLVALVFVHPEWTLEQGQFAWLLLILFTTILIGGAGRLAVAPRLPAPLRYA